MATVESIQASGGDYTTPQAWFDAHKGDITSDANAPYIGEMAAEDFTTGLVATDVSTVTDSTHYFHLRAKSGAEFKGDFDASYPVIKAHAGFSSSAIELGATLNYTRIEHIVCGEDDSMNVGIYIGSATHCLIDSVGIHDVTYSVNEQWGTVSGGIRVETADYTDIRNCVVGDFSSENTKIDGDGYTFGIYVYDSENVTVYNNSIQNMISIATYPFAVGIDLGHLVDHDTDIVKNNVVGTVTGGSALCFRWSDAVHDYNASSDSTATGTNSITGITPGDEFTDTTPATLDIHLKSGASCRGAAVDLSGTFTDDIDGETRDQWDIGADEYVVPAEAHPQIVMISE